MNIRIILRTLHIAIVGLHCTLWAFYVTVAVGNRLYIVIS
jgi:hypothetical protein